jgi:hypothetical protein
MTLHLLISKFFEKKLEENMKKFDEKQSEKSKRLLPII